MQQASSKNRSIRETNPLQSLGTPGTPTIIPGCADAHPSLQLQNNLGIRKAWRNRSSKQSLQNASFKAQRRAMSFPGTNGTALASKGSLAERPHLEHFALGEEARPKLPRRNVPPSPQTQLDLVPAWAYNNELSQLRAEIMTLQEAVRELADRSFSKSKADNTNNNKQQRHQHQQRQQQQQQQ